MAMERRVDPDALLEVSRREEKGKLTVFLGAAAGVGKTYAMLESAHERLSESTDVVVGWVETHGRQETAALLEGLPVVSPRSIEYHGRTFQEMDLDALLARHPELALVDELAHSNIPGSRHARRYQDVEELLNAGVNVFVTLNIQHIESLNDVVARITGVRVHETVPDRLLEKADQIQLIDIPPEELLQRLQEGKVYVPEQAEQAVQKFFRPGNINALRELALRHTAERVDNQLRQYMRVHAISGPWPAGERVMACVSASPFSAQVIRTARRMAANLKADLLVAYVERVDRLSNDEEQEQLQSNLRLAEGLGAEVIHLSGDDVAAELLYLARRKNVTQLVVGKALHSPIRQLWRGSLVDRIIRGSTGIGVHIVPDMPRQRAVTRRPARGIYEANAPSAAYLGYVETLATVAVTGLFSWIFARPLGITNIALLFLLPVLYAATRQSKIPAILASLLGVLAFDFLFIPPRLSFTVQDVRYLLSFAIFVIIGMTTATLATRLRRQVEHTRKHAAMTESLYGLSRSIAAVNDTNQVIREVANCVAETVQGGVAIYLPARTGRLEQQVIIGRDAFRLSSENELAVATWVFEHGQTAGKTTDTLSGATGLHLPLKSESRTLGVLAVALDTPGQIPAEQRQLLEAVANLTALALTRLQFASEASRVLQLAESERLRSTVLNSISHDLRTPLASIIGAATGLLDDEGLYDDSGRESLLLTIKDEAIRMNTLVNNLLDMTRLESGALRIKKDWCDIQEIIGVALRRCHDILEGRPIAIDIPPGLLLVSADFGLIEQVLVNLLDNAVKYSPKDTAISLRVFRERDEIQVEVADRGPGLPAEDVRRVFEKFSRSDAVRHISGTGLGLSICRGFIEAHGGRIWAANRPGGGAVFAFTLPNSAEQPPNVPAAREGDEGDGKQQTPDSDH